jgi:hypothetical protein
MKHEVIWPRVSSDTEWIYIGAKDEIQKQIVFKIIYDYFTGNELYVACSRQKSFATDKVHIEEAIENLLGAENFYVWDKNFKKAIEFNQIGVMRKGQVGN